MRLKRAVLLAAVAALAVVLPLGTVLANPERTSITDQISSTAISLNSVSQSKPSQAAAPVPESPTSTQAAPPPIPPQKTTKAVPPKPVSKAQVTPAHASNPATSEGVIGTSPVVGPYTQYDLYWLAKMVYAESAKEPYAGQVAVAAVILHRVASADYPNKIKEVEFQVVDGHYQFTPVLTGYINQVEPNATSYQAAKAALAGQDPSKGSMLYYNPATSTNKWILSRPVTIVIGNHTFAK